MLKNIRHTITTRFVIILLTFAVVWMNLNHIGAAGQGDVALISLGILFIVGLNNFMGGGSIVYLTSRVAPHQLLWPCFAWSVFSSILFYFIFLWTNIVPQPFVEDVALLGFLQSLFVFQQQIALGRNEVGKFNALVVFQLLITTLVLAYFYFFLEARQTESYVAALYISFLSTLILGIYFTRKEWKKMPFSFSQSAIKEIWKYGFYASSSNIFQLLAYRMSYIFLEQLGSRSQVGIFSVGMQINEAVVTPVKSIATVQYAHLANSPNQEANVALTVNLLKLALALTLLIAGVVIAIPESIYTWIFSDELVGLKSVLYYLFGGMGALSISSILAHHFSGLGKYKQNTIGSLVTLSSIALLGLLYIKRDGIVGAAWISSVAYGLQALYLLIVFVVDEAPDKKQLFRFSINWNLIRNASKQGK